jgi:hypothetical protein
MIDEIPIIGVTEWTVDGLAAKEFRRRAGVTGHRLDAVQAEQGGEGKSGTGNLNSWSARYFR